MAGRFALLEREAEVAAGKRHHIVGLQGELAHRRGELEVGEPLAHEQREVLGVAGRHDQADRDFGRSLVAVPEPQDEALHAARACGEIPGELDDQPPRGEEQRLGLGDFGGKLDRRPEPRRRDKKIPRIGKPPERAVGIVEQPLPEAPRHAFARQRAQLTERADADRFERRQRFIAAAQDLQGQRGQRRLELGALADEFLLSGPGEPESRARRGGAREHRAPAHFCQPPAQALEKRFQAAEELQATRDFEQHAIGKFERHARCELRRPPGYAEQRFGFRRGVAGRNAQGGRESERCGCSHAGANAARECLAVAGENAVPLFDRERLRRGRAAQKNLERQLGQPDGDPHDGFCCARRAASPAAGWAERGGHRGA